MRFLADENFNRKLLTGLKQVLPDLDIIRIQETHLVGASDPVVLEWAAQEDRILLTHDVQTIVGFAYERVRADLPMPGVIEVKTSSSIGTTIEELAIMIAASKAGEFENQVKYIPIT